MKHHQRRNSLVLPAGFSVVHLAFGDFYKPAAHAGIGVVLHGCVAHEVARYWR